MTVAALKPKQAVAILLDAGFPPQGAITMAAIGWAESRLRPDARGVNDDGSVDRGWLQINDRWHAEVSDACAYDPACAAKEALRISNGGTSFSPWSTFNSGAYRGPEGLVWTLMNAAYTIVVDERLLADRQDQIDSLKADLANETDILSKTQASLVTATAERDSARTDLAAARQTISQLNAKIIAARADLA